MRKKTKSIVTEYETLCFYCGAEAECNHHLLFGSSNRTLAEEDGLTVPACHKHHTMGDVSERVHDNPMAERLSKMLGQAIFEKEKGTREEFRKRYHESYL